MERKNVSLSRKTRPGEIRLFTGEHCAVQRKESHRVKKPDLRFNSSHKRRSNVKTNQTRYYLSSLLG